jgi:hypothetical protein
MASLSLSGLPIADRSSKYTTREWQFVRRMGVGSQGRSFQVWPLMTAKFILVPLTREELLRLVYGLGERLASRAPGNRDIAILLPNGMDALICFETLLFG